MSKQLIVKQVTEAEGVKTVLFSNGRTMVYGNGVRKFFNEHGRGLNCTPASRHYEACVDMWQAYKAAA